MKQIDQFKAALVAASLFFASHASAIDGAFYGTNYTVPFAHSYRALNSLGIDPKSAIDKDVYHFSRLGLNAFRLHLWDVELSDSVGNLLDNDHLDCLDYLIFKLEQRNISIVLTAQTNFGNGYPERNSNPNNAYSYKYDKCDIHDNASAVKAQERYISTLVKHVNKYTGKKYSDDNCILALEINNEPCHSSDKKAITEYINRMIKALKHAGWRKDIFYNVSHNLDRTSAFFDAKIDGATFQWYPLGLVSGHQLHGNFLPFVDEYNIPFDSLLNKNKVDKIVYEFDPADNLYSYLYPAAARSFRAAGFKWITQFAYDPIDIAWANTEYQTHYLNLAYTPNKAIGMMIAAEVVKQTPLGSNFGKYPQNTKFGNFTIDPKNDLATLNNDSIYYYTNSYFDTPKDISLLRHIAGVGSSTIVKYNGSGAYFVDKIDEHTWRLEVMPDIILTRDPFEKTSLKRKLGEIIYNNRQISISLNNLSENFSYRDIAKPTIGTATNHSFFVSPGVYLLSDDAERLLNYSPKDKYGDGTKSIGEYVAPKADKQEYNIIHTPKSHIKQGDILNISATVLGEGLDSVYIYPADVSFWRAQNNLIKMNHIGYQQFEASIPIISKQYNYNIVAFYKDRTITYPSMSEGTPLDWDFPANNNFYHTYVYRDEDPIPALVVSPNNDGAIFGVLADNWAGASFRYEQRCPLEQDVYKFEIKHDSDAEIAIISKDISELVKDRNLSSLKIKLGEVHGFKNLYIGLVTNDGFTFKADILSKPSIQTLNLDKFELTSTINPRNVYPLFINRIFTPESSLHASFKLCNVDNIIIVGQRSDDDAYAEIYGISIEN
jgi:hypothetical protein